MAENFILFSSRSPLSLILRSPPYAIHDDNNTDYFLKKDGFPRVESVGRLCAVRCRRYLSRERWAALVLVCQQQQQSKEKRASGDGAAESDDGDEHTQQRTGEENR